MKGGTYPVTGADIDPAFRGPVGGCLVGLMDYRQSSVGVVAGGVR